MGLKGGEVYEGEDEADEAVLEGSAEACSTDQVQTHPVVSGSALTLDQSSTRRVDLTESTHEQMMSWPVQFWIEIH